MMLSEFLVPKVGIFTQKQKRNEDFDFNININPTILCNYRYVSLPKCSSFIPTIFIQKYTHKIISFSDKNIIKIKENICMYLF